ncbi:SMP-30/gluconolactonase/LRE family protein [Intrasporangium mesophilum]
MTSADREARVVASDVGFTEGPVFLRDGRILFVSIDHGTVYAVDEAASAGPRGAVRVATVGGGVNGATEGRDGLVYLAQAGGRGGATKGLLTSTGGVLVYDPRGVVSWLTMDPISPNDLAFGPDGLLYVTDPTRSPKRADGRVFRIDVDTGLAELLCSVPWYPNGIAFGPEDDAVYVADTRGSRILRFPLSPSGLGEVELVVRMDRGRPDGFCFDSEGNIVIAAIGDDGEAGCIQTWTRDGESLDSFDPHLGQVVTNVAISSDRRCVITAAGEGKVAVVDDWPVAGLELHPFRNS